MMAVVTQVGINIINGVVLSGVGVYRRAYATINFGGLINRAGIEMVVISQTRIVGILLVHHMGEKRQLEKC